MTSERAFWKALGMGSLITLAVWTALFFALGRRTENLLACLLLALFTLIIVVPLVYKSYRREGETRREPKPSHLRLLGGLFIGIAIIYAFDAVLESCHPRGWDLVFPVVMAIFWCVFGIEKLRRAAHLSKTDQTTSV